jgi:hypothetical protein
MNLYLYILLGAVVVVGILAFRLYGQRVRCPFCREWLPRGAVYQVGRKSGGGPYLCPYCDHAIGKRDLQRTT